MKTEGNRKRERKRKSEREREQERESEKEEERDTERERKDKESASSLISMMASCTLSSKSLAQGRIQKSPLQHLRHQTWSQSYKRNFFLK